MDTNDTTEMNDAAETTTPQPLDALMNKLGLSNAELVAASTDQLTFKMVNKGRKGRRLTPNIQEKIYIALLAAKPDLKVRRRDLFRYPLAESIRKGLEAAEAKVRAGKINYPGFIDLLERAGIHGYTTEVAQHRITYYAPAGEAQVEQGPVISEAAPGFFDAAKIQAAISDTQKKLIDYPTFLKRIHEAGVVTYDVNTKKRLIVYRGEKETYKEAIPTSAELAAAEFAAAQKPAAAAEAKKVKAVKGKKAAAEAQAKETAAKKKLSKTDKKVIRRKKLVKNRKTGRVAKKHRVKRRSRRPYAR